MRQITGDCLTYYDGLGSSEEPGLDGAFSSVVSGGDSFKEGSSLRPLSSS